MECGIQAQCVFDVSEGAWVSKTNVFQNAAENRRRLDRWQDRRTSQIGYRQPLDRMGLTVGGGWSQPGRMGPRPRRALVDVASIEVDGEARLRVPPERASNSGGRYDCRARRSVDLARHPRPKSTTLALTTEHSRDENKNYSPTQRSYAYYCCFLDPVSRTHSSVWPLDRLSDGR